MFRCRSKVYKKVHEDFNKASHRGDRDDRVLDKRRKAKSCPLISKLDLYLDDINLVAPKVSKMDFYLDDDNPPLFMFEVPMCLNMAVILMYIYCSVLTPRTPAVQRWLTH